MTPLEEEAVQDHVTYGNDPFYIALQEHRILVERARHQARQARLSRLQLLTPIYLHELAPKYQPEIKASYPMLRFMGWTPVDALTAVYKVRDRLEAMAKAQGLAGESESHYQEVQA